MKIKDDVVVRNEGKETKREKFVRLADHGVCQEFCVNRFNKQHRIAA